MNKGVIRAGRKECGEVENEIWERDEAPEAERKRAYLVGKRQGEKVQERRTS